MLEIITHSAEETKELGRKLGKLLEAGDILCLTGDLGSGKTAFTGGIASALGINGYITSPTFAIVNEYRGRFPFYHFDVYRVENPDDMWEIGFEEYMEGKGVVVIEWADLIREILPKDCIWVDIRKVSGAAPDTRRIRFDFHGKKNEEKERCFIHEGSCG